MATARDRLNAFVTFESDEDAAEFERRVNAVVAEELNSVAEFASKGTPTGGGRRAVASLGTPCACSHSRNWHRYEDDSCTVCDCVRFVANVAKNGSQSTA